MGNNGIGEGEGHSQGRNQKREMSWKGSTEMKELMMRVMNASNTRFLGLGPLAGVYRLTQKMCLKCPSQYLVFQSLKQYGMETASRYCM